jgi:O-antigen ligase
LPKRADDLHWNERAALLFIWLLVLVPPFLLVPGAQDGFRLPKLMLSELLGLGSLLLLALGLLRARSAALFELVREPVVLAVGPLLLVVTALAATSPHQAQVRSALADLWIGGACLVGWTLGLPADRLRRPLFGLVWPAVLLALVAGLQFHGLQPFQFAAGAEGFRHDLTSLAGNPGDLGMYLVVPLLLVQARLAALGRRGRRWPWVVILALLVYALAVSQTLTALLAALLSSLLFWTLQARVKRVAVVASAIVALAVVAVVSIGPLRERVENKVGEARRGEINALLTGRLDGWRAAWWMFRQHPLTGVGQGAYRSEFAAAKLALVSEGVSFYQRHRYPMFVNAHNEVLEVAAEWGIPGLLVLLGAGIAVSGALRRSRPPAGGDRGHEPVDQALSWSGLGALLLVALFNFPFRLGLTSFPALLLLAWLLRRSQERESPPVEARLVPTWTLAAVLVPLLAAAVVLQARRGSHLVEASRILELTETSTKAAVSRKLPRGVLVRNLELLDRAERLDRSNASIVLAEASHQLLLGRNTEAERIYRRALALEPRPEIFLNLGRAQWRLGKQEEARESFAAAIALMPSLRREVPREAR